MPTVEKVARTDAGLASELRSSVMRLRRRLVAQADADDSLSVPALSTLGVLHRRGPLTVGELAAHERVRPPSMTRTLHCLEDAGLVARAPHPTDGRQVVVTLTDAGRARVVAERRRRDAWLARRLAALDPEEREVLRRAAPLLDRLSQED
ncbi:MarR family transcriptional regulator [Nocardioides sp. TRM66260-LWL]|uniref:MarR family winged helix-turn-helix transcriptional regulator n=1 Tax=Nocardioides sp. TRM66260-LWL TaxID=2874478 RepID=UPI001CC4F737|nr:MarR family transcriptional regulator [Nocardioides sp. TRM66260-LWL]MBZ5734542.1 MarR family transcriptional regulator [Nocardioides sp. TRM66260-LWL]